MKLNELKKFELQLFPGKIHKQINKTFNEEFFLKRIRVFIYECCLTRKCTCINVSEINRISIYEIYNN